MTTGTLPDFSSKPYSRMHVPADMLDELSGDPRLVGVPDQNVNIDDGKVQFRGVVAKEAVGDQRISYGSATTASERRENVAGMRRALHYLYTHPHLFMGRRETLESLRHWMNSEGPHSSRSGAKPKNEKPLAKAEHYRLMMAIWGQLHHDLRQKLLHCSSCPANRLYGNVKSAHIAAIGPDHEERVFELKGEQTRPIADHAARTQPETAHKIPLKINRNNHKALLKPLEADVPEPKNQKASDEDLWLTAAHAAARFPVPYVR